MRDCENVRQIPARHAARGPRPFAESLNCRDAALTRDECGDPVITGKAGHVYAVCGSLDRPETPGFHLFFGSETARAWAFAKRALAFAILTNDGDEGGAWFLDRLPTVAETERFFAIPR